MTTQTGQMAIAPSPQSSVFGRLSLLDRFLPVWIFLAMALGIALGKVVPDIGDTLDSIELDTVLLPIAIGHKLYPDDGLWQPKSHLL